MGVDPVGFRTQPTRGAGTGTLPGAKALYLPLAASRGADRRPWRQAQRWPRPGDARAAPPAGDLR
ncbi:MAG: hypothetical protein MZV70_70200 [Desulfobacterales bacterium]|nr:hypothetical protein [Desulfobacterales bacterium]